MVKIDSEFIKELKKKLLEIDNSSLNRNNKLGKIGETFVKDGIKRTLWDKGFCVGIIGNNKFSIKEQYKVGEKGTGGIDFYLKFRVNGVKYKCFIEVKNWMKMRYITPDTFKEHILNRFEKHDKKNKRYRIVVINKRNIHLISMECKQNNINLIPLEEHITSGMLNIIRLKDIMEHFVDDFSILIDDITTGRIQISVNPFMKWLRMKILQIQNKIYRIINVFREEKEVKKEFNKTEKIKDGIRKGLPYPYIANKYDTSVSYVKKVASNMRKNGEIIMDRRTNEWKGIQYLKWDDFE